MRAGRRGQLGSANGDAPELSLNTFHSGPNCEEWREGAELELL